MSGNLNYQVRFSKNRNLSLFRGIKWRYWLTSFSLTSSASRKLNRAMSFSGTEFVRRPYVYAANWKNNLTTTYEPFESMKFDFSMNEERNLAIDHYFHSVPIGVQTKFGHNLKFRFQPSPQSIFSNLRPNFEMSTRYTEDLNPNLRQGNDPFGTRNVGAQRNISLAMDIDVASYMLRVGEVLGLVKKGEVSKTRRTPMPTTGKGGRGFKDLLDRSRTPTKSEKAGKVERMFEAPKKETPPSVPQPTPSTTPTTAKETPKFKDLGITKKETPVARGDEKEGAVKADTTAAADTSAVQKPDPLLIFKELFRLFGRVEVVKANININHQNSYQRLYDRADLAYQFGFTDKSGVRGKSGGIEDQPERVSESFTLDLRSGLDIASNVDLLVNFNLMKRTDDYSGRVSESDRTTWPSISLSLGGMEKIRLLRKHVKSSNIKLNFERTTSKDLRGTETSYSLSPIWSMTWKNTISTNVSFTYNKTTSIQNEQEIWSSNWAVTMNLKYSIKGSKGFSIPLPLLSKKKFKFSSTLNTSMDLSYVNSARYNQPPSKTISLSPRASYRFSNRLTGSFFFNFKRTSGGQLGYIYNTVGLGVSAEFRF